MHGSQELEKRTHEVHCIGVKLCKTGSILGTEAVVA